MKLLLIGLLIISSLQNAIAESTDILQLVREKTVELRITKATVQMSDTKKNRRSRIENLPSQGICSGAVINNMGDILTARHCTDGASQIMVVFFDGREYAATVLKQSNRHDLALIHVDRFNIPHFNIAKTIKQGQTIWVMGNPLGISATLSQGVVAKLNGDVDFIDVTVLPGNSGGPAFNKEGELVGITTAGFVVLMGFAHLNIMQSIDAIFGFALEIQGVR